MRKVARTRVLGSQHGDSTFPDCSPVLEEVPQASLFLDFIAKYANYAFSECLSKDCSGRSSAIRDRSGANVEREEMHVSAPGLLNTCDYARELGQ
jgi:hypothetical protein